MSLRTSLPGVTRLAFAALTLASGCNNGSTNGNPDGSISSAVTCESTGDYPPPPYGTTEGTRVADFSLRIQVGKAGTPAAKKLSDYRAQCVAGKLKVLAIFGAAEWCGPCKNEQPDLVQIWTDYQTAKAPVAFVEVVTENGVHTPSDDGTVNTWATTFGIPFDIGRDPDSALGPYFQSAAFPQAMVIRLDDMSIQSFWQGNENGKAKTAVDAALQP